MIDDELGTFLDFNTYMDVLFGCFFSFITSEKWILDAALAIKAASFFEKKDIADSATRRGTPLKLWRRI